MRLTVTNLRNVQQVYTRAGGIGHEPLPTPPSSIKFSLTVKHGFREVLIEIEEYLTATDIHDNMANTQRIIDQAIVEAFKKVM